MDDFNKAVAKEYTARDLNCGCLFIGKTKANRKNNVDASHAEN